MVAKLKDELFQRFCRDCYTTTTHKVIEVSSVRNGRRHEKTVCLKCVETMAIKRAISPRRKSWEDILKV